MSRGRNHFHTAFHVMEERGAFRSNPANSDAVDPVEGTSLYSGPIQFPKMFYHPLAETRVIVPAQAVVNPQTGEAMLDRTGQPIVRGEQREIVHEIAQDEAAAERLREAGWHDHPAKALLAAGLPAPATSSQQTISDLEKKLAQAQAQLASARSGQVSTGKKISPDGLRPAATE